MGCNKKEYERLKYELNVARQRIRELEAKGISSDQKVSADGIFCAIPDMIWVKDKSGTYLRCNPAYETLLGYPQEEIVGKAEAQISPQEWGDANTLYDHKVLDSGEPVVFEKALAQTNDRCLFFEIIKTPLKDINGNLIGVLSVARNISERKLKENALAAEVRRSKMLMEISYDGIAIFNQNHRVIEANTRFMDMLGYSPEEITTLHSWDFDTNFTEEEIQSDFKERSEPKNIIETQHRRKDGSVYDAEVSASGAFFDDEFLIATITRDISERREKEKLTRKINQMNKMEAVGQLAAGIAHDFNNVLTGIVGAAKILGKYLPHQKRAQKMHQLILDTADRASSVISSLLAFSRESPSASTPVDLHHIIQETITLLKMSIDKRIVLKTFMDAPSSSIIGDFALLQNALLNLCINSCHAMPDGGTLTISTTTQELDKTYCKNTAFDIPPGLYIEMEVRDTGCGIPKELLDKIFEPFFTTKEQRKGTGLGLSSVFGVVQQHSGAIFPYSEPGSGTVFQILFPLNQDQAIETIQSSEVPKGVGTILVVDDDEAMREIATAILEDLGYRVVLAQNGEEALQIYDRHGESINLVLLDMVMPLMHGLKCYENLKTMDSNIRVIFSSGFMVGDDLLELEDKDFIRKPYHASDLGRIVYKVLNRK